MFAKSLRKTRKALRNNQNQVKVFDAPKDAVKDAHLVVTDVWASMGQEDESESRIKTFSDYQVTPALMDVAQQDALFMHCLPAHRGEEVSSEMMDDPRNVAWTEAGNRLHAQKALIEFLLLGRQ